VCASVGSHVALSVFQSFFFVKETEKPWCSILDAATPFENNGLLNLERVCGRFLTCLVQTCDDDVRFHGDVSTIFLAAASAACACAVL
jgi:hypothetical protein